MKAMNAKAGNTGTKESYPTGNITYVSRHASQVGTKGEIAERQARSKSSHAVASATGRYSPTASSRVTPTPRVLRSSSPPALSLEGMGGAYLAGLSAERKAAAVEVLRRAYALVRERRADLWSATGAAGSAVDPTLLAMHHAREALREVTGERDIPRWDGDRWREDSERLAALRKASELLGGTPPRTGGWRVSTAVAP
jgi:hypothetical protein